MNRFNPEFVPFLETYFQTNAFPSSADHAAMATMSGMAPRQVEVWFQNQRRRAKMDGRACVRRRRGGGGDNLLGLVTVVHGMRRRARL
ncbi:HD2 homeodomain mating-type protein [Mycena sanguinolenta]|uniref:HD2 homeodomain mating-type protein n=1 Tax=Mycena sanguinolenta TaxID=230812 RepID=A0A8H6XEN3_9AGAR|nr:HD2 homeodomain mating-type protein [Mycena sanguinolenta]